MIVQSRIRPDGSPQLVLSGDLDTASADEVRHAGLDLIAAADGDNIILIDLADVPFIDSTGLGALIALQNAADQIGLKVALLDPSSRVVRVLEITNLTDVFAVKYDRGLPKHT
jgi:anti-anti-sigma factor